MACAGLEVVAHDAIPSTDIVARPDALSRDVVNAAMHRGVVTYRFHARAMLAATRLSAKLRSQPMGLTEVATSPLELALPEEHTLQTASHIVVNGLPSLRRS